MDVKPMHLPLELVLIVITCSVPKPGVLLRPSHPITQTLLSFTLVCHETRKVVRRPVSAQSGPGCGSLFARIGFGELC